MGIFKHHQEQEPPKGSSYTGRDEPSLLADALIELIKIDGDGINEPNWAFDLESQRGGLVVDVESSEQAVSALAAWRKTQDRKLLLRYINDLQRKDKRRRRMGRFIGRKDRYSD